MLVAPDGDEPEDAGTAEDPDQTEIHESTRLVDRAVRAAWMSWGWFPASIATYTNLRAAKKLGIRGDDSSRAASAAVIALVPALIVVGSFIAIIGVIVFAVLS